MTDPTRRALRTLLQVGIIQGLIQLWNAFAPPLPADVTSEQAAAITLVFTPILGFLQNFFEDRGTIVALLKAPASPGVNPIPEP